MNKNKALYGILIVSITVAFLILIYVLSAFILPNNKNNDYVLLAMNNIEKGDRNAAIEVIAEGINKQNSKELKNMYYALTGFEYGEAPADSKDNFESNNAKGDPGEMEYETGDPGEAEDIPDDYYGDGAVTASAILKDKKMTENEFIESCIPLQYLDVRAGITFKNYDIDTLNNMFVYSNDYMLNNYQFSNIDIVDKAFSDEGYPVYWCAVDHGKIDICLLDMRDTPDYPAFYKDDILNAYVDFYGIGNDSYGNEELIFRIICCEKTNERLPEGIY